MPDTQKQIITISFAKDWPYKLMQKNLIICKSISLSFHQFRIALSSNFHHLRPLVAGITSTLTLPGFTPNHPKRPSTDNNGPAPNFSGVGRWLHRQDYSVCPDFEGHRLGHAPQRVHPHSPFDTDDWVAMTCAHENHEHDGSGKGDTYLKGPKHAEVGEFWIEYLVFTKW